MAIAKTSPILFVTVMNARFQSASTETGVLANSSILEMVESEFPQMMLALFASSLTVGGIRVLKMPSPH
jgi:hypothetical protein